MGARVDLGNRSRPLDHVELEFNGMKECGAPTVLPRSLRHAPASKQHRRVTRPARRCHGHDDGCMRQESRGPVPEPDASGPLVGNGGWGELRDPVNARGNASNDEAAGGAPRIVAVDIEAHLPWPWREFGLNAADCGYSECGRREGRRDRTRLCRILEYLGL